MARPRTRGQVGAVAVSRTIQSSAVAVGQPEINFDWGPKLIAYSLQVGGNTYPWLINQPVQGAGAQANIFRTAALQELTFTANVRMPIGTFVTEYEWNFGDGQKGYGEIVTHKYTTPSPSTRTRLCITDNRGRRFCIGKPMNLYAADLTVVGGFVLVNPPIYLYGDTTSGSIVIRNLDDDTGNIAIGMKITGTGVPLNATVTRIGTLNKPTGVTATPVASGGTFAAGTYYWKVTAIGPNGETMGSTQVSAAIVLNGSATISWSPVTGATSYRVYRGSTSNAQSLYFTTTSPFTDTGAAGTAGTVPPWETSIEISAAATATNTNEEFRFDPIA